MRRSLAALAVLVALDARADPPAPPRPPDAAAAPAPAPDAARRNDVISWEDAAKHVGEAVTVEGIVHGMQCTALSCLFAFEPTFKRFTAVIPGARFNAFPPRDQLDQMFTGKKVRVHGTVRLLDGKPEIPVQSPADFTLAPPTPDEQRHAREETEQARTDLLTRQTEVLEQLSETLQGLQEVIDRLAASQERTEAVLARLDDQIAALAAASAPQAYTPAPPPPAYEALRSVKRGMSQNDVVRLVGQPLQVERWDGGEIWHYDYGRSVTFNARGRAESLVGFQ